MARKTEHKEATATVKVIYRTAKKLSDGSHPFWVRITKDRKSTYVATGLSLDPKYWNNRYTGYKEAIRKSYGEPFRGELVKQLQKWEQKYSQAADSLAGADEVFNSKAVATKAVEGRKKIRQVTLLAYIDELVASMATSHKNGNRVVYKDLRNQLSDFIFQEYDKATDLSFSEVNIRFCNKLEVFLRHKGNTETTLSNRFRTLRAVINKAIAEEVAKPEYYPFARSVADKHKFSIGKFNITTQKRAISREDVQKVEAFIAIGVHTANDFKGKRNAKAIAQIKNNAEVERLKLAQGVFLFSFYCGGINFVDLAKLQWRNIKVDAEGNLRLTYVRQKTGGKFSIRLLAPAILIIEQLRSIDNPNLYIFPILNSEQHTTEMKIKNRLHKVLGQVNADLKLIGERVGIQTPLTTYVARHSFATTLRQKGTATAIISQAMGHKTEAVTAIYLDSFASETVDAAYEALL